MITTTKFDSTFIELKSQKLTEISDTLKHEFFGLDEIIDKIVSSVSAWYIFPELITRPVIVNLWGLTGVGKTHLVRRLVELLEFSDRFLEVQMDGIGGSSNHQAKTLASLLGESSIDQGIPGIILLDEFQRFRTIDGSGVDIKLERFQDVWMLLSDGKFAGNSAIFSEIEMVLASSAYYSNISEPETETEETKPNKRYSIYPYEAQKYKRLLRLTESIQEIMTWTPEAVASRLMAAQDEMKGFQLDYSKCLIFISGNLDEAFDVADAVNDSDTDADTFHARSKRISVHNIKTALQYRFKPEQISRLGNNHIIYPSITKESYKKLIHRTCFEYINKMVEITGIRMNLKPHAEEVIYNNSVYPAQGTRPVFSSIHAIFSDALVKISFWAIQNEITELTMDIDADNFVLVAFSGSLKTEVPVLLDIDAKKKKTSADLLTMIAVHEAGHALVSALLTKEPPLEIKINAASFNGGFVIPGDTDNGTEPIASTKQGIRDTIATYWAGRVAEEIVFGPDNVSNGAENDIYKATNVAAGYVSRLSMDVIKGRETNLSDGRHQIGLLPSMEANDRISMILKEEKTRATGLITANKKLFIRLVDELLAGTVFTPDLFKEKFPEIDFESRSTRVTDWSNFKGDFQ